VDYSGEVTVTVTVTDDNAPTLASIELEGGNAYTGDPEITVELMGVSGNPVTVRYSFDDIVFVDIPYDAQPFDVTLPAGDGLKDIYIRLVDAAANESVSFPAQIRLDTLAPTGTVSIDQGGYTNSLEVDVTITGDGEPTEMQFSTNGFTWSDWMPFGSTEHLTLPDGTDGRRFVLMNIRDAAGNLTSLITDEIEYDSIPPVAALEFVEGEFASNATIHLDMSNSFDLNDIE